MKEKVRSLFRKGQSELSRPGAKISRFTASGSDQYKQGTETMFTWLSTLRKRSAYF